MQIIEINEPGANSTLEQDNEITVGIDFGTTNSLIAISNNKQIKFINDVKGREIIPSIIEWDSYGHFEIGNLNPNHQQYIYSIKRLLGKSCNEILSDQKLYKGVKDIIDLTGEIPKLKIQNKFISLPEIAAEIFKYLKNQAENELNTIVKKAVVTVPAYFDDGAKGAVMLAAKIAGFQVLRLIAEPTAAAYAYGLNKSVHGCYLVYDLGGGTFDVSILNMQSGILQVIATGGNNMLGGDDIDILLTQHLEAHFKFEPSNILKIARDAKEFLTYNDNFQLNDDKNKSFGKINVQTFEEIISPLIQETINIVKDTYEQANTPNLDGIILVGGSSRIPLITKMLKQSYNVEIFNDVDPDRVVANGAALQAENLTSNNLNSLLIDVVPLSIGLELYGGLIDKIILRNSPMPLSVTKEFTTQVDNQNGMQFHVLQGERELANDCRSLARFELKGIPPMKAGNARIEVTFSIDADGILSVSAQEKVTGKSQAIEVRPAYGLEQSEIDKILEEAFKNAAKDHEHRLLQEDILNAKSLIYNIENAIKEMPNILPRLEMDKITESIEHLSKILDCGKREVIIQKTKLLEKQTEKFVEARFNFAASELLEGKLIDKLL